MRKNWIAAAVLAVALTGCGEAGVSGTPMPLTEAGMEQLNRASGQVDQQAFLREAQSAMGDYDKSAELLVGFYTELFDAAGYSLEATLVEVGEGLGGTEEERRAFAEASHWGLGGVYPIAQGLAAIESKGLDLADYMHADAAEAVRTVMAAR